MVNSPTPAAARIALTKASATGLRSTLAIPGRASSSEEICDPPSSAGGGIEHAAPALKVAPSYIGPTRPSRIFDRFRAELSLGSAVTTLAQGLDKPPRRAARDGEVGVGQELAQHCAGPRVERHSEMQVELILRVIGTLTGEGEALGLRSGGVDLDLRERLVWGAVHGHLRGQPPGCVRDTPRRRRVKEAHLPGVATFRAWRCDQSWDDAGSRNTGRPKRWR